MRREEYPNREFPVHMFSFLALITAFFCNPPHPSHSFIFARWGMREKGGADAHQTRHTTQTHTDVSPSSLQL